jgi:PAS domain S-box-containing protein
MSKKSALRSQSQEKLESSKSMLADAIEAMKGSVDDLREQLRDKEDCLLKPLEKVGKILSIGMIVCDYQGVIILANNEANLIFGYDSLLEKRIDHIIEHQTLDNNSAMCFPKWLKANDLNLFQPNKEKNLLFGIKKDFSKIYIHVSASGYPTKEGGKHYILMIEDTSKSAVSNRQNIDLLEKFQSLSNTLNLADNFGICILETENDQQQIIYCNSGFTKITGYTESKLPVDSVFILEGEETEKDELERIRYCMDHETTYEGFIKCYDKEGNDFIGNVKITTINYKDQNKVIRSFYVENIASRHDTVYNLKRRIKILEYLEEIAGVGWWILDTGMSKLTWSQGVFDIHEISSSVFQPNLDTALNFYSTPEERAQVNNVVQNSLKEGTSFEFIANITTANNTQKEVYVKGATLKSMPDVVFGIVSDLTYKKHVLDLNDIKL